MSKAFTDASDMAAAAHPLVIETKLLGTEATLLAAVAKKIAENVLDVGKDILDRDIKTILEKSGTLISEFRVEFFKTRNNIDQAIQKELYNAEIIKAIKTELMERIKMNITDNEKIKQISSSYIDKILYELLNDDKISTPTSPPPLQNTNGRPVRGWSSIKTMQRGGQQSLKRTAKSINEFLNSSVTSSHILNMVKKGGRTKRRLNRHAKKYKTRRRQI